MAGGARSRVGPAVLALSALAALLSTATPVDAAPPPYPLPWQRTYVAPDSVDVAHLTQSITADCQQDTERGLHDNGVPGVPKIAVLGDSVQDQTRNGALADHSYRWMYATHCGEKFATTLSSGRVADAVAANPDVLVFGLGPNDMTEFWQVRPDFLPAAISNLNHMLDATEGVPCRIIMNLPEVTPDFAVNSSSAWIYLTQQLNAAEDAAQARHGVHVADWRGTVGWYWPAYLADGLHMTGTGVNARINLAIQTARQCSRPDTPINLGASAANGTAAVWWDPLPDAEKVTQYRVTASDGRSILTSTNNVNFPGLANGTTYQFRVTALNGAGEGDPTAWSGSVVPSAAGARFHAITPTRVLDTRSNKGKAGAFGPGEVARLPLGAAVPIGASAVALNVTAAGQTADTVVTVWPNGQSKPLASNLNPHPGVDAVPAMVTARLGPDNSVLIANSAGTTHLVADVIGYYGAPGDGSGSLYVPTTPTRLLDSRDGTGGRVSPFGDRDTLSLPITQLPDDATAAVLNVTSANTTRPGYVTLWPHGQTMPLASNLNPQPGLTRANLTVAKVGSNRTVDLYNNSGATDLLVDLVGYYTADGVEHGGSLYYPITPERVYDTRFAFGGIQGPISNVNNLWLAFAGRGAVPASGVTAIDANVTITNPVSGGHTTVWPVGTKPTASNLNYQAGETVANRDPIGLSGGTALLWSATSSTNYVIDTNGWWGPPL